MREAHLSNRLCGEQSLADALPAHHLAEGHLWSRKMLKRLLALLTTTGDHSQSATERGLCEFSRARLRRDTWKRLGTDRRTAAAQQRHHALAVIASSLTDQELDDTLQRNVERGIILWTERARRNEGATR